MLSTVLLIVGIILTLMVGAIVVLNNHRALVNRTLVYIACSLILWELVNFLADRSGNWTLFWNRAAFVGPLFVFLFSNRFVYALGGRSYNKRIGYAFLTVTLLVSLLCVQSDAVITEIQPRLVAGEIQGYDTYRGSGYILVIGWLFCLMAVFLKNLISLFIHAKGRVRQQYRIVIMGALAGVVAGSVTNILLPVITGSTSSAKFAPLSGLIFMTFMAIAIIKHGLFNVRILVVRALAYSLSVLVISLLYGFTIFGLANFFFDLEIALVVQAYLSVGTGVAVLLFGRVKGFFDKVSERLFYQDAYDAEEFFDSFNKAVVSTIDLDLLLQRTTRVIAQYLKAAYVMVEVDQERNPGYVSVGTEKLPLRDEDIALVRKSTARLGRTVIVTDDLPTGMSNLQVTLQRYDIALLIKLTSDTNINDSLGFLALGSKKSGNPYTNQDIRVVEAMANELMIALQNALRFEEIERFNETLQKKVEDATRKLRESNKKLKQLNESKDDFIGMTSHQLRTPLTSIKGYISLVMDGDAGKVNETQRKLLAQAFSSSQKMVHLIADLLNVSRLKTGKFTIEHKPTDLAAMIKEELAQLNEELANRKLELTSELPEKFPVLPLDDTKTRQVIMNFLDNAMYYTPAGGRIYVELKELSKTVEFRVVDSGIGVPKDERHRLFTKFYRAKNALRARPDGTGLGLYMARKVITAQGGAIIFDSTEGQGSTFGFMFPKDLTPPTGAAPGVVQVED